MLWVADGNDEATKLYERMGFAGTGRSDRLPTNPRRAILEMARAL